MRAHIIRKDSTKRTSKAGRIVITILLIITFFALAVCIWTTAENYKEEQIYNDVLKDFENVCDYVECNIQAYETLSAYEISQFDGTSAISDIKAYGEYQDERTIVYSRAKEGRVMQLTENVIAKYTYYSNDTYFFTITYSQEPVFNIKSAKEEKNITEHLQISLHRGRVKVD